MKTLVWKVSVIFFAALIVGCSGGGGGGGTATPKTAVVSGVAASGSPLAGQVYLKESRGNMLGPVTIGSDGSFSFDVTKYTAPFYLEAVGTAGDIGLVMHSAATGAGTANINPFTDIVVAAAAGVTDPATVFGNPAQHPVTQADLNAAVSNLQAMLKPVLDAFGASGNPLSGAYTADHTGLDAVFDLVWVVLDPASGAIVVVDRATGGTIASATTTTLATPIQSATSQTVPSSQTLSDLNAIAAQITAMVTILSTKGANTAFSDIDPFFATNFGISDGADRTSNVNGTIAGGTAIKPVSVTFPSLYGKTGNNYIVDYFITFADGTVNDPTDGWVTFTQENGVWKFTGNGFNSYIDRFCGESSKIINADGSIPMINGLDISIGDPQGLLAKGIITGPGLPSSGITIDKQQTAFWFSLDPQSQPAFNFTSANLYAMSDATIGTITGAANGVLSGYALYTIAFYDANNNQIETRTLVAKRPYMSTELTDASFPSISITSHALPQLSAGSDVTFTYAEPTAFQTVFSTGWVEVYGTNNSTSSSVVLPPAGTSATIPAAWPAWSATSAYYLVSASDVFKRRMIFQWWMN